jgi:hypothetical protein
LDEFCEAGWDAAWRRINTVLDLIDTESGMAMHAAFGLIEALLGRAGDWAGLVTARVCASPTENAVQTFQTEEVWGTLLRPAELRDLFNPYY